MIRYGLDTESTTTLRLLIRTVSLFLVPVLGLDSVETDAFEFDWILFQGSLIVSPRLVLLQYSINHFLDRDATNATFTFDHVWPDFLHVGGGAGADA